MSYIGHVQTPDGLKLDPNKVKAIGAMPTPSNKKALLGMITYLAKFLPNLSDLTEPLRRLLDKDVPNGSETIHKRNHESK